MNSPDLAAQLRFTYDDLAANRDGSLSDAQRVRLRRSLLRDTALYALVALLPLGALILALGNQNLCGGPLALIVLTILTAAFVIYIVSLQRSTRADLASGVRMVSGRVETRDVGRGFYRLHVGALNFQVSAREFYAFVNGSFYRIYYTPNLKTILSAELAED